MKILKKQRLLGIVCALVFMFGFVSYFTIAANINAKAETPLPISQESTVFGVTKTYNVPTITLQQRTDFQLQPGLSGCLSREPRRYQQVFAQIELSDMDWSSASLSVTYTPYYYNSADASGSFSIETARRSELLDEMNYDSKLGYWTSLYSTSVDNSTPNTPITVDNMPIYNSYFQTISSGIKLLTISFGNGSSYVGLDYSHYSEINSIQLHLFYENSIELITNNQTISLDGGISQRFAFTAEESLLYNLIAAEGVVISVYDDEQPNPIAADFTKLSIQLTGGKTYCVEFWSYLPTSFIFTYNNNLINAMSINIKAMDPSNPAPIRVKFSPTANSIFTLHTDSPFVIISINDKDNQFVNGGMFSTSAQMYSGETYYIEFVSVADTTFTVTYNNEIQPSQSVSFKAAYSTIEFTFTPQTTKQYTFNAYSPLIAIMVYDANNVLKGNGMNSYAISLNAGETYCIRVMALTAATITLTYN